MLLLTTDTVRHLLVSVDWKHFMYHTLVWGGGQKEGIPNFIWSIPETYLSILELDINSEFTSCLTNYGIRGVDRPTRREKGKTLR